MLAEISGVLMSVSLDFDIDIHLINSFDPLHKLAEVSDASDSSYVFLVQGST